MRRKAGAARRPQHRGGRGAGHGPVLDPRVFDGVVPAAAVFAGPGDRLLYANDAFTRLFGPRQAGLPAREVFPGPDAYRFLAVLESVRSTGRARQVFGRRRSGPGAAGQAQNFVYTCTPVTTAEGPGVLALAMDTPGESADGRLYETLVKAVAQTVWVKHADGTIEETVPGWERLTGTPRPSGRLDSVYPHVHPRDREGLRADWEGGTPSDASRVVQSDYRLRAADGTFRHVTTRAVPVDPGEADTDWIAATVDVEDSWNRQLRDRLMVKVAGAASESLPEAFAEVVQVIVPELADYCLVLLLSYDEWPPPDHAEVTARRVATASRPGLPAPPALRGQSLPVRGELRDLLVQHVPRTFLLSPPGTAPPGLVPTVTERWLAAAKATSMTLIPLAVDDIVLGYAVTVTSGDTPTPTPSEVSLLREVLHQAERPIRKVLDLQQVRRIALGLQRAHLTDPPSVPGAVLAARYQPAGSDSEIGGDWYDAFPLPDNTLILDIGDVGGHDLNAATAMTQMRSMLRALAYAGGPGAAPADVLARLDETAEGLATAAFATAIHATLHRHTDRTWQFTWSNAGHPPPLLIPAHGDAHYLDAPADLPLCVLPGLGRTTHTHTLNPGDTLLLYTDGLIETPSTSLDTGLSQLATKAALHRHEPLPHLLRALQDLSDQRDDTAMLAIRIEPVT
ncbi:SpoIIE family protein phosphatase [Streptomyces hydrogenans]|uniref:SpoIIE family protein phosphatase n=1 Tax=Streptomyces hydrogenans TaxID=1873719 RepID=UPI00382CA578